MQKISSSETTNFIHDFNEKENMRYGILFVFIAVAVIVGCLCGFLLAKSGIIGGKTSSTSTSSLPVSQQKNTFGIADKKEFKDSVEGVLKEGGIEGEGNFHLERPGGKSQNVYLTSSTVDLEQYIGKKVKVWGKTFQGEKAGWLMDVGLIELQ